MNPGTNDFLDRIIARLTARQLIALHRIAKSKRRGVRPFFADPRAMAKLRRAMDKKRQSC